MSIARDLGKISANIEAASKAREFSALARCLAIGRGERFEALRVADEARLPRIREILSSHHKVYALTRDQVEQTKAAVAAGGTAVGDWSEQLAAYNVLAAAFLESLRNYGAFDAMLPAMRRVPFRTRIGASTSALTGSTVSQSQAKPVSKLSLTNTQIDEIKVAALMTVTNELARFGDVAAGNLFATELANAVAVATDSEFIAQLVASATTFASNGATAEHTRVDLRGLLANVTTGARSSLFLLTTSTIAKALSVLNTNTGDAAFPTINYNGGTIAGIQVLVSDGVSSGNMILADASQIAAASETVTLSASTEAIVNLDTAPDSPLAGSVMTSLWQMNQTGIKAERFFGVEKLTTTGVAVVTGVAYTGDSPGP